MEDRIPLQRAADERRRPLRSGAIDARDRDSLVMPPRAIDGRIKT
jgi:hypothetical protein